MSWIPSLEYRRKRADLVEALKIMNGISGVDKDKFFTISNYRATRGRFNEVCQEKTKTERSGK